MLRVTKIQTRFEIVKLLVFEGVCGGEMSLTSQFPRETASACCHLPLKKFADLFLEWLQVEVVGLDGEGNHLVVLGGVLVFLCTEGLPNLGGGDHWAIGRASLQVTFHATEMPVALS